MTASDAATPFHPSGPTLILHAEAGIVLAGATFAYAQTGASWWLFALVFFAPDLAVIGYLANTAVGAALYNLAHTYIGPGLLLGFAIATGTPAAMAVALIWIAHIGFDRLLGFGLKYSTGFKQTHLSRT